MPFSSYTDTQVLDHLLGAGTFTKPAALYTALFIGDPTAGGTEVSGGSYVRQSSSFTISGNVATNTANIEWATATASWGTVTHIAIYDALSSGNQLVTAELGTPKIIVTGDVLRIPAGQLSVSLT